MVGTLSTSSLILNLIKVTPMFYIQPEDDVMGYGKTITLDRTLYSSHINQGAGLDAPPCNSGLRPCWHKVWPRGKGTWSKGTLFPHIPSQLGPWTSSWNQVWFGPTRRSKIYSSALILYMCDLPAQLRNNPKTNLTWVENPLYVGLNAILCNIGRSGSVQEESSWRTSLHW